MSGLLLSDTGWHSSSSLREKTLALQLAPWAVPDRFKDTRAIVACAGGRQHAQAACQHGGCVRQDISKDIPGHNGVKESWIPDNLHSRIVHIPAHTRYCQEVSQQPTCKPVVMKAVAVVC